tara:strand:- start:254 stop:871 length:618 start_codon:yes stop_codon:yes gene_type:complete
MIILNKINLKSSLKYKLWIIVLILYFVNTGQIGINVDKQIKARQPDFIYNNSKEFINAVKNCIKWIEKDTTIWQNVSHEIIIATSIIESDYGTSRFAKQANNLFGIRTYNLKEPHIKPLKMNKSKFGLKVYKNKCDSVKDYISVLNNSFAFEEFRELRYKMLKNNNLDTLLLVQKLKKYAENPNYVKLLTKTIKYLRNERISNTN